MRWTRPETWHLTLLFVGSVEPRRASELEALVRNVAEATPAYDVRVDQGGGRLRRGEGVAWLGLSEGATTLIELASELAVACAPDLAHGPPKRTPSAHLTLVRRADAPTIQALRQRAYGHLSVDWQADRIALVRSHLDRSGARYETLHEATM